MKLRNLGLVIVAALMFVACEKEEGTTVSASKEVAGSYTGYSLAKFQYSPQPMVTDGETVVLQETADGTVSVSYTSSKWGEFSVPAAKASGSDGIYVVMGEGTVVMGMSEDSKKEYQCSLNGTVNKTDGKSGFVFSVPAVMGGLNIEFYTGDMPSAYALAGTYNGVLKMEVGGKEVGSVDDSQFTIENTDGKIALTLKGFGFGGMQLEDIKVSDVEAQKENESYRISSAIDTTSGSIKVTGKLEGVIDNEGNASVVFTMKPGAMPMEITASFTGKKQ